MTPTQTDEKFLHDAVDLARQNVDVGGQPFGAVLVNDGVVLGTGVNEVHLNHDPTAHAEIQALRHASQEHRVHQHPGAVMYASGHPCAMCMTAMIQAGIGRVVYAAGDDMGEPYGWSTKALYAAMRQPVGEQGITVDYLPLEEKRQVYERWRNRL